jgi:hypothetical protein
MYRLEVAVRSSGRCRLGDLAVDAADGEVHALASRQVV